MRSEILLLAWAICGISTGVVMSSEKHFRYVIVSIIKKRDGPVLVHISTYFNSVF